MRKNAFLLTIGFSLTTAVCFCALGRLSKQTARAEDRIVYIGGMPAGFTLSAGGAQIIGTSDVMTEEGVVSPSRQAGLKAGDIIKKAAGVEVTTIADLNEILSKNGEKPMKLTIFRGETQLEMELCPVKDRVTGRYKIGVLIRDSLSGIGTVTYIDKETGRFGALGHSVVGESKQELSLSGGAVYTCSIMGITKGVRGRAGELRGMFLADCPIGKADKICSKGIFGQVNDEYMLDQLQTAQVISMSEAKIGCAYIYSTVSGVNPKKYEIEIVKIDKNNKSQKNYVLKITDKALLEETGGIVQGMSGSPILQNGKLIGAVTHVFLNDPSRGYGIDVNSMLKE